MRALLHEGGSHFKCHPPPVLYYYVDKSRSLPLFLSLYLQASESHSSTKRLDGQLRTQQKVSHQNPPPPSQTRNGLCNDWWPQTDR